MSETLTIAVDGGELAGWREGSVSRTAVMLHGGPALSGYLDSFTPLLGETFTTVRFQQRGPGAQHRRRAVHRAHRVGELLRRSAAA